MTTAGMTAARGLLSGLYHAGHRCKKNVLRFLKNFVKFFYVFKRFFYFPNVFKNVGKVQSGKQINKKNTQNNSNEIDQ